MKPDTTTANNTALSHTLLKKPFNADDWTFVESDELSTTSHINNLRNPLTNINMAVEMLASMAVGEDEKRCLEIILRSSNRIKGIVSELVKLQDSSSKK